MRPTFVLALASLAACADDPPAPIARLSPVLSCSAAKTYLKQVEIQRMNQLIDAAIKDYEANGGLCTYGGEGDAGSGAGSGGGGGNPPPAPGGPSQGTGTNNQVAGVDEADFIKNDGNYIYLAQNGVFRIVSSWPADQTHVVSTTPITGTPKKMFVLGDTALVYAAVGTGTAYARDCTYGYDCDFAGDGTSTKLLVFDITDRTAPQLTREIDLSGSLIAARRVGSAVHTVVTQTASLFPDVSYSPDVNLCGTSPFDYVRVNDAFNQLRAKNRDIIMNTDLDLALPTVTDSAGLTPQDPEDCSSLLTSAIMDGTGFTSLVSIDMDHPGPVKTSTIISASGAIYASAGALYMAVPHAWNESDLSTVHKFRISDVAGQTKYEASGLVKGRALNQFAMDEQDGVLRIATTDGHVPDPNVISYVSTLEQQHDDLVTIGQVSGIAPHEDIRSVRFDGNRGFVVTFKKTDPLYVFDLTDPHNPTELGELQIPGFSTYMHMMDDTHLMTIGYNANDEGSFAWFDGVMLQIFDVTDPANPQLAQKYVIGTRGSSSEALTDHLAFTWYPEQGLLSLPMTICEGGGNGVYGDSLTFSGLIVFDASIATGFAEHGRVPVDVGSQVTCYNWWTDATSVVKRSLFLDRFVYSLSDAELKVRSVDALSTELVTVPLQ